MLRGKLQADLVVEDCPSLEAIDMVFPRDALPPPSVRVRRCERLKVIGRPSSKPRMCGDLLLEDCPQLEAVNVRIIRGNMEVIECPRGRWDRATRRISLAEARQGP
jgi:hypothetical protein